MSFDCQNHLSPASGQTEVPGKLLHGSARFKGGQHGAVSGFSCPHVVLFNTNRVAILLDFRAMDVSVGCSVRKIVSISYDGRSDALSFEHSQCDGLDS